MSCPTRFRSMLATLGAVAALLVAAAPAAAQQTPVEFRVIPLSAGIHVIQAEVAQTEPEREQGLMFRKALGPNQGMLFLFEHDAVQCMWMKNTLIGLSVAFLGADGRVINVEDMAPQTEDTHCATKPARYAIEMNLGWFAKRGIRAGAQISGLPTPNR